MLSSICVIVFLSHLDLYWLEFFHMMGIRIQLSFPPNSKLIFLISFTKYSIYSQGFYTKFPYMHGFVSELFSPLVCQFLYQYHIVLIIMAFHMFYYLAGLVFISSLTSPKTQSPILLFFIKIVWYSWIWFPCTF